MKITRKWKKILSTALACLLLVGAVGAVASFATNDTKTVSSLAFGIGAIDIVEGTNKKDNRAIFTKDLIACDGLKVSPNFDNTSNYQIFWYNYDKVYIGCTSRTVTNNAKFDGNVPYLAEYARIVIYPNDLEENLNIFDISKYTKNIDITVNKKQDVEAINLLDGIKVYQESMGSRSEILRSTDNIIFENASITSGYMVLLDPSKDCIFEDRDDRAVLKMAVSGVSVYRFDFTGCKSACVSVYKSDGEFVETISDIHKDIYYLEAKDYTDMIFIFDFSEGIDDFSVVPYLPKN